MRFQKTFLLWGPFPLHTLVTKYMYILFTCVSPSLILLLRSGVSILLSLHFVLHLFLTPFLSWLLFLVFLMSLHLSLPVSLFTLLNHYSVPFPRPQITNGSSLYTLLLLCLSTYSTSRSTVLDAYSLFSPPYTSSFHFSLPHFLIFPFIPHRHTFNTPRPTKDLRLDAQIL